MTESSQQPNAKHLDLLGATVHWLDFGGPANPEALLVCVHGLGGSAVNWSAWAPLMTERCRVVALDLAGFGYTEPGERSASLAANAALVDAFAGWARDRLVALAVPLVLVGNSMGGLLAAWATDRRLDIAGLALLDPALPHPGRLPSPTQLAGLALYAHPAGGRLIAWGRRRVRSPEQLVGDTFRLCLSDPDAVSAAVTDVHVALARHRLQRSDLDPLFEQAARETVLAMAGADLADAGADLADAGADLAEVYAAVRVPVLMVHGTEDRLVPYSAAVAMWQTHPTWDFVTAAGSGHVPMLESPAWLAEVIKKWLAKTAGRAQDTACDAVRSP